MAMPWRLSESLGVVVVCAALAGGCYVSTGPGDNGRPDASDEFDVPDPPICLVDILMVLDPKVCCESGTLSCHGDYGGCDFEAFDAQLAAGGVSGYHFGSVFAIGGPGWQDGNSTCPLYLTPGVLNGGDTFPFRCPPTLDPLQRWAEGPGETAAAVSHCLTRFGHAVDYGGRCHPMMWEAFKVVRLATSPPLVDERNAGMFRPDALLVVVSLLPRDDLSVQDPWVYETPPSEWPSLPGVDPAWQAWLEDVDEFVAYLEELKQGRVAVALWGGPDGVPGQVIEPDGIRNWEYVCPWTGGFSPQPRGVTVAPRFHRLLRALGSRAMFVNACEVWFRDFLPQLAEFIVRQLPAGCAPEG
ncbi:MAG: hypothetical protein QME96_04855 [Myxococcota bacterium]|nr:hypothetical protein [Myxococcota bacterium]